MLLRLPNIPVTPGIRCLHLLTFAGFAVAQPLYDLLAGNPGFFTARQAAASEILVLVLVVSILAPLGLFLATAMLRPFSRIVGDAVYALLVAVLAILIILPLAGELPVVAPASLLLAVLAGAAGTSAYLGFTPVRQFVSVASPAIVIFPLLFLLSSPVRSFVMPDAEEQRSDMAVRTSDGPLPDIVMVLLDELPMTSLLDEEEEIDATHFPGFAAIANNGHLFRNTTAVADNTLTAIPAVLTGNYPREGLTATSGDHPRNLFTLLKDHYELNVIESVTELCPDRLCPALNGGHRWASHYQNLFSDLSAVYLHLVTPERYREHLPDISNEWKDFRWHEAEDLDNEYLHHRALAQIKTDRADKLAQFIESIESTREPTLHFLHILLPHAPYTRLPSGKLYTLPRRQQGLEGGRWQDNDVLVEEAYRRHLLQLAFVDRRLGELVERLQAQGFYDSSLLVVAADHGVSFRSSVARRALSPNNYADITHVPLLLKWPGQARGVVSERRAQTIDILPTILDVLDIEPRKAPDGRSLLKDEPSPGERTVYFEHAKKSLVINEGELSARRRAALRRKLSLLGQSNHGLYGFGRVRIPARPLDEYPLLDREPVVVELNQSFLFDDVDPAREFVPTYVSGRLHGAGRLGPEDRIGIAVNGVLWVVTPPAAVEGSRARFSAIIPEEAFAAGANKVEVFVARPTGGGLALVPGASDSAKGYRLAKTENGGEKLIASDGTGIRIRSGELQGWLDGGEKRGELLQFGGWAGDVKAGEPARHVVMFKDGEFVYMAHPDSERTDVLQFYDKHGLRNSGFNITLPARYFRNRSQVVRVFAVSDDGRASELRYFKKFEWKKPEES